MRGALLRWETDERGARRLVLVSDDAEVCGISLDCGGHCCLEPKHEGPCSCRGDFAEPGDCPA